MTFDVPTKLDIGRKDIIDWYDGVISAVLDLGDDAAHLLLCIAWSPDYDERVYGLLPIAADAAARLRELLERSPSGEHWSEITAVMNEAASAHVGQVTVVATDPVCKEVLGRMAVPSEAVPEIVCGKDRTAAAYDEPGLFAWLDRLGVPKPLSWREKEKLEDDGQSGGEST